MDTATEDYALAIRAREGDREALAALVERLRTRLFALAYAELRDFDDAQDAVAAALLQICTHVHELRRPERLREWMACIVRNEVRRLRRRQLRIEIPLAEVGMQARAADPVLRLDIERSLRNLPGDQARAIRWFYLSGLSLDAIADRLGCSEGTVKSWLHRGRKRLALELEDYAPMITESPKQAEDGLTLAAVVHTELEPTQARKVAAVLRSAGFEARWIASQELQRLQSAMLERSFDTLDHWLRPYRMMVLDERILNRSVFEFLINGRDYFQTRRIEGEHVPVCLLLSSPDEFTLLAAWNAGVDGVVDRNSPEDLRRVVEGFRQRIIPMKERLTQRCRQVIALAQEEAARLGHPHLDTEHLLLALLVNVDPMAARILERLGTNREQLRKEATRRARSPEQPPSGEMRLLAGAQAALALAYEEAQLLGSEHVGTEHLLLGLVSETRGGVAGEILREAGATPEAVRSALAVLELQSPAPSAPPAVRLQTAGEMSCDAIPETLPVVPIREPVYLPRSRFPLFCGRLSSIAAVEAARGAGGWIVLAAQRDATMDAPEPAELRTMAIVARILEVVEISGTLRTTMEAQARVRIRKFLQTDPWLSAQIELVTDEEVESEETASLVDEVRQLFRELASRENLPAEAVALVASVREPGRLADTVASFLGAGMPLLQELLETPSPRTRLERLRDALLSGREDLSASSAEEECTDDR